MTSLAQLESTPISEYAVVGDMGTAALISRSGSVDWLCLPRFDSPACFAALLGTKKHGHWLLTVRDAVNIDRRYVGETFVLETVYTTARGKARVRDAMPLGNERADFVRHIEVLEGQVEIDHEWIVRFDYGDRTPWIHRTTDRQGKEVIRATAGPDSVMLRGDRLPHASADTHIDRFTLNEGESTHLAMTWIPSWADLPNEIDISHAIRKTHNRWEQWVRTTTDDGEYDDLVRRSLLVLRLLTHRDTGGIVAAATTSLPEMIGGERNWDYRFCWLRDASLTVEALIEYGYYHEADRWRSWLLRAVAGDPDDLQIMYGVDGSRQLPERLLEHLPGYANSRPVRVGNAAVKQTQNDVLGEVMSALFAARQAGLDGDSDSWSLQRHLLNGLLKHWHLPDRGIWEMRGKPRHFTHSKIMVWAALDRAIKTVEQFPDCEGPLNHWRRMREIVREDILKRGVHPKTGGLVQYYGATHTDAALLQSLHLGFVDTHDPIFKATIEAIESELLVEGFVLRYRTEHNVDGLPPGEHPFLACSFWLADAYARMGRITDAETLLNRLKGAANDVGLFSEEYDPENSRMIGNFPQAFSHLAFVRAAWSLERAKGTR